MGKRVAEVFSRAASDFGQVGPHFFTHDGCRLVELARITPTARVLDVATGRGAVLFPTAEQIGPLGHIVGVDLADGMVQETAAEIREINLSRVSICQMDAERLACADAAFDMVLSGHAIIFFPTAATEFNRVLRPGGKLGLTIIAQGCFDWLLELFRLHAPPDETDSSAEPIQAVPRIDTPDGMADTLTAAGFRDLQITLEETVFVYADEAEWWSTLWTLGFRGTLERMEHQTQQRFKTDLFQQLQAFKQRDGFHLLFQTLFAFGTK